MTSAGATIRPRQHREEDVVNVKRSLLAMLLLSQMGQSASADPPEWARDAVDAVQQRGIMKGYPDGSLDGERPVTRNELAEIIERLDQQRLREESAFTTQAELDEAREATSGLVEQIDALDTRVENLEDNTDRLQQRNDEVR